jgi:Raf kinase inhibitor-like YbhB/YbcL family protein
MKLSSQSFAPNARIPDIHAYGNPAASGHVRPGGNRNPHLAWSDVPPGTRSFALICHDPDVPGRKDDVNREDRTVPADLPRVDFFHWVLVDLAPGLREIAEGNFSAGITEGGKPGPDAPAGSRQGVNDYSASNYGYDGPCPPWNDALLHHYIFTLYALDIARCPLEGKQFDGAAARAAIRGHILAEASLTGTYSLNPAVR